MVDRTEVVAVEGKECGSLKRLSYVGTVKDGEEGNEETCLFACAVRRTCYMSVPCAAASESAERVRQAYRELGAVLTGTLAMFSRCLSGVRILSPGPCGGGEPFGPIAR